MLITKQLYLNNISIYPKNNNPNNIPHPPYIKKMHKKHELTQKLQKDQNFYNEMLTADLNYKSIKIHANYQNILSIYQNLVTIFQYSKKLAHQVYFIFGMYINQEKINMELIMQYFITILPKPKNSYILAYFNDFAVANNFTNFKNMLNMLPIQYFINLEAIYLVRPSLKMKATKFFTFGIIPKYINNKIINIRDLDQLGQKIGVRKQDIVKFLPMEIRNNFVCQQQTKNTYNMLPILTKSLSTNNDNHQNLRRNGSPKNNNNDNSRSAILQSPINQNTKIPIKYQINQYDKSQSGVPQVFVLLLEYFKQRGNQLEEQGIFRKSVNIQQQTQALQKIHRKQYEFIEKIKDPHLVANLIKRFLSKLKTPIIDYQIFYTIIDCQDITPQFVAQQIKLLNIINQTKYLTLMALLDFFIGKVIPRSHKNKMQAQNIAICFAPCLMWAEQRSIKDLIYVNKSVCVLVIMINNFQKIFGTKKKIHQILRLSYNQQKTKNIIQTYNIQKQQNNQQNILQQQRNTPNFGQLKQQKSYNQQQQDQIPIQQQKAMDLINLLYTNKSGFKDKIDIDQQKDKQQFLENQLQKNNMISHNQLNKVEQQNIYYDNNDQNFKQQIIDSTHANTINQQISQNTQQNDNKLQTDITKDNKQQHTQ